MARYRVGAIADLPPGSMRLVEIGKRNVGVYNIGGTYHAINSYCPHQGGPLCLGTVTGTAVAYQPYEIEWVKVGEIVRCPWHRWEVDIPTGSVLTQPVRKVKRYAVHVEDGQVVLEA